MESAGQPPAFSALHTPAATGPPHTYTTTTTTTTTAPKAGPTYGMSLADHGAFMQPPPMSDALARFSAALTALSQANQTRAQARKAEYDLMVTCEQLLYRSLSADIVSQLEDCIEELSAAPATPKNEEYLSALRSVLLWNALTRDETDTDGKDIQMALAVGAPSAATPAPSTPAPSTPAAATLTSSDAPAAMEADAPAPTSTAEAMDMDSGAAPTNATTTTTASAAPVASKLSPEMLLLLRAQVQAYRDLARSEPLHADTLAVLEAAAAAPARALGRPVRMAPPSAMVAEELKARAELPASQAAYFKTLRRDREFRIASRISYRINELQNLPDTLPQDLRTRAMIELRSLRLKDVQKNLRQAVQVYETPATSTATAMRREALRREYPLVLRDARHTEALEQQRRVHQMREEQRQKEQRLTAILEHIEAFKSFHEGVRKSIEKVAKGVGTYVQNKERKMRAEQERTEKERIRLLQAHDTEGYRKLLDAEKDSRKKYLLDKIDEHMREMDAKIFAHQQKEFTAELEAKKKAQKKTDTSSSATAAAATTATAATAAGAPADGTGDAAAATVSTDEGAPAEEDAGAPDAAAGDAAFQPVSVTDETAVFAPRATESIVKQPNMLVFGTLKPYQLKGLEWLVSLYNNKLNGILADEMGLGKTIQSIALITYLVEVKNNFGPYLVIVPLATLSNWVQEFQRWAPSLKTIIYNGSKHERKYLSARVRAAQYNVLVTTYEFIIRDKAVLATPKWQYMIVDEGHRMKNSHCKLTQVLTKFYTSQRRLLLTGTPLQNNLPELWALLNFLLPDVFNSSQTFESWFNAPFAGTGEQLELDMEETQLIILQLHKILRPFLIRRLKKEVETQLPDKVEYILKAEMSALQRRLYTHMQKHGVILMDDAETQKKESAQNNPSSGGIKALQNTIMQLRKICNHPFIFRSVDEGMAQHIRNRDGANAQELIEQVDIWRACGKFELLDKILEKLRATGHRTLIFSQSTQLLTIMEDYLRMRNILYFRMDGSTKTEDRAHMLTEFNRPGTEYDVFLLSTRAGGLGLNLQTADTVIIYDSDWNPHQDLQAQDRAHRIGQKHEVRVLRLCTINSVEEKILERAQYKLKVDAQVIQAGKFNQQSDSLKESRELLESVLRADAEDEEDEGLEETLDDESLNDMLARSEEELEVFARIDEERRKRDDATWVSEVRQGRLMQKHELPDWAMKSETAVQELVEEQAQKKEVDLSLGRGTRARKEVNYSEELTEREFLMAVEAGTLDEAIEKKQAKKRKRNDPANDGSPAASPAPSSIPDKSTGRRGASGAATTPSLANKRSRREVPAKELPKLCRKLVDALVGATDKEGREIADLFMDAPDREEYPDYYEVVKKPIGINDMKRKSKRSEYESVDELEEDVLLMVKNAHKYNEEGSEVYDDANALLAIFRAERDKLGV